MHPLSHRSCFELNFVEWLRRFRSLLFQATISMSTKAFCVVKRSRPNFSNVISIIIAYLPCCFMIMTLLWLVALEKFKYVVVVSHIWELREQPDPLGVQFENIQMMLRTKQAELDGHKNKRMGECVQPQCCACLLIVCCSHSFSFFLILSHPRFAFVLCSPTMRMLVSCCVRAVPDTLNSDVGLFYDYSCLPQKPRTADEETLFLTLLKQMDQLYGGQLHAQTSVWSTYNLARPMARGWPYFEMMISGTAGIATSEHFPTAVRFHLLFQRLAKAYVVEVHSRNILEHGFNSAVTSREDTFARSYAQLISEARTNGYIAFARHIGDFFDLVHTVFFQKLRESSQRKDLRVNHLTTQHEFDSDGAVCRAAQALFKEADTIVKHKARVDLLEATFTNGSDREVLINLIK